LAQVEVLSVEPEVYIVHDVLSDKEINYMKESAVDKLQARLYHHLSTKHKICSVMSISDYFQISKLFISGKHFHVEFLSFLPALIGRNYYAFVHRLKH
jgi:hypothetical protein